MNRICIIAALSLLCPGVALADPLSIFAAIGAVAFSWGAATTFVGAWTAAALTSAAIAIPAHRSPRAKRRPRCMQQQQSETPK